MKDLYNNLTITQALRAAVWSSDALSLVIDTQGYESLIFVLNIGDTNDTLSGSDRIDFKMQESDESGAGFTDCADADMIGAAPNLGSGIVVRMDSSTEDRVLRKAAYIGSKRYVRFLIDFVGTHTNGTEFSIDAIQGHPAQAPVA